MDTNSIFEPTLVPIGITANYGSEGRRVPIRGRLLRACWNCDVRPLNCLWPLTAPWGVRGPTDPPGDWRHPVAICIYVCAVPGRPKKRTSWRATEAKKLKIKKLYSTTSKVVSNYSSIKSLLKERLLPFNATRASITSVFIFFYAKRW